MVWVATGIAVTSTVYGAYQTNRANKAARYADQMQAAADAKNAVYAKYQAHAQASESINQGVFALREAAMSSALTRQEALDLKQASLDQADKIKQAAMFQRGQIVVAQSASGTMIGEGSAQASLDQLDTLSSADALVAIYSGVNAAASKRLEAQLIMEAGKNRARGFVAEGASQRLSGDIMGNAPPTAIPHRPSPWAGALLQAGGQLAGGYVKSTEGKKEP